MTGGASGPDHSPFGARSSGNERAKHQIDALGQRVHRRPASLDLENPCAADGSASVYAVVVVRMENDHARIALEDRTGEAPLRLCPHARFTSIVSRAQLRDPVPSVWRVMYGSGPTANFDSAQDGELAVPRCAADARIKRHMMIHGIDAHAALRRGEFRTEQMRHDCRSSSPARSRECFREHVHLIIRSLQFMSVGTSAPHNAPDDARPRDDFLLYRCFENKARP